jgi:hypothetical protein
MKGNEMNKRAPVNTTEWVNRDPLAMLAEMAIRGSSGAIEAQEAAGQRDLVSSDTLPTEMRPGEKEVLETAGVKFLGPVQGDSLFQYVELPKGWSKRPTEHSMWSDLVDDKGRKRAGIFYKAAFYDRGAHLHLNTRYTFSQDYDRAKNERVVVAYVMDGETRIYTSDEIRFEPSDKYPAMDRAEKQVTDWLKEHYPEWQNPAAYWD